MSALRADHSMVVSSRGRIFFGGEGTVWAEDGSAPKTSTLKGLPTKAQGRAAHPGFGPQEYFPTLKGLPREKQWTNVPSQRCAG